MARPPAAPPPDEPCLSDAEIALLARGDGAPAQRASLLAHLDACPLCLDALGAVVRGLVGEPTGGFDASSQLASRLLGDEPGAPVTLQRGQVVADRYVILDPIGRGGMGRVYLAHDNTLRREVALKLVTRSPSAHPAAEEARTLAAVRHPHVVAVFDVVPLDGRTLIAMEHVRGPTLRRWVAGGPPRRAVVRRLFELSRGLAATHAAGLVHGDVKPSNALIGREGGGATETLKLADFGLAHDPGQRALGATRTFAAPEVTAEASVSTRSDVYSLAATWVACLAAQEPEQRAPRPPTAPAWRARARACRPRWVRRPLARALADDPALRPRDAEALIAQLRAARRWGVVRRALAAMVLLLVPLAVWSVDRAVSFGACMAPWSDAGEVTATVAEDREAAALRDVEAAMGALQAEAARRMCEAERDGQADRAEAYRRCLDAEAAAWARERERAVAVLHLPDAFSGRWGDLRARVEAFRCLDGDHLIAMSAALVRRADYEGLFSHDGDPRDLDAAIMALREAGLTTSLADALVLRGVRAAAHHDPAAAKRDYEESLLTAMASRDALREATAWALLARTAASFDGDFPAARIALRRAEVLAGPTAGSALTLFLLELNMLLDLVAGYPERIVARFLDAGAPRPEVGLGPAHVHLTPQGRVVLAHAYLELGWIEAAALAYRRQLDERRSAVLRTPGRVAGGLNNLAMVHLERGELAQARELAEEALAIRRRHLGWDHRETLRVRRTLAHLDVQEASSPSARRAARSTLREVLEALAHRASVDHGPGHVEVYTTLVGLSEAHADAGACADAQASAQAAIALGLAHGYDGGRWMVRALHVLADCAIAQGEGEAAVHFLQQAEGIPGHGLSHPGTRARHDGLHAALRVTSVRELD